MIAKTTTTTHLSPVLAQARAGTDALFGLVRPEAFYERPVPERHRIIFYCGHLEAFDWNLVRQAAARPPFHPELDQLFAFGIDPGPGQLPQDKRSDWPAIEEVQQYNVRARRAIDELLIDTPEQLLSVALEHRLMHAETFAYLLHDLPLTQKTIPPVAPHPSGPTPIRKIVEIPAGTVTLGQRRKHLHGQYQFGWDNEFDGHEVSVSAFAMSKHKVTNGEYLEFVGAGAKPPHFWTWHEGQWCWRGMSGLVPLPLDWPVYVTHVEACDFAAWNGKRLPTEAEFHRAAYGTLSGESERSYPWGDEQPDTRRGNFDGNRWDPLPVTATPLGDSAFGISQLVGNGWEWTSTVFQPFPGFQPLSFYPGYSSRFFDGEHYVLKGASSRTDASLLRRSFRNWFRPNYRYVYAGFRCVEN
ncbi:MAG TPA: SUMF1/EgtB/PvdO family nonheme iron enzyme [Nitrospiraceae bacterium]|nr:SUMF1/EgtB/PvdO family nonheme iron enzyme [Nitrospiraceae bacterium]